jgi:hypothetical protein
VSNSSPGSEPETPPRLRWPSPGVQGRIAVAAGGLSFALGLLGYLLPEAQRLSIWSRLALIALPLVIYGVWWLTPRIQVALARFRWYDKLYESFDTERMRLDAERMRVDELTQILATTRSIRRPRTPFLLPSSNRSSVAPKSSSHWSLLSHRPFRFHRSLGRVAFSE